MKIDSILKLISLILNAALNIKATIVYETENVNNWKEKL